MVRKSVFEAVAPFDETMRLAEDIDLWCRIARRFPLGTVEEPLVYIRWHKDNVSSNLAAEEKLVAWLHILDKMFAGSIDLSPQLQRKLRALVYYSAFSQQPYGPNARQYLLRSYRYYPGVLSLNSAVSRSWRQHWRLYIRAMLGEPLYRKIKTFLP